MNSRATTAFWARYHALGIESGGTVAWFWIGPHKKYERLIG
jgi:hypothetical protein